MIKESVAKITKVYSTSGELSLRLYDNFDDSFVCDEPFYVCIDSLEVPVYVGEFSKKGASKAVVRFDDIDSEVRALEFVGKELYLYFEEEKDEELYYENMVGYTIIDEISGKKGVVTEFVDYNNNPLFDVDFDGVNVMVPLNDEIISEINEDEKRIVVSLPEGLMALYAEDE